MIKNEGNEMKYIQKYLDTMLDEGYSDSVLQVSVRDGWAIASIVDQPTSEALLCFEGEHFMTCACSGGIAEALAMLDARVQKYCFPDTL